MMCKRKCKMKVICFGDSNTYGYDPRGYFGGRYGADCRWVDILAAETGWTISNMEQNGREIPVAAPAFPDDTDLLIVMLGTNDTKERLGANACAIGKGLRRLVRKAQSIDCWAGGQPNLLIVAPPAIGKGVERSPVAQEMGLGCVEKSLRLPGQFRAVAAETRCHFLDALNESRSSLGSRSFMY